MDSVEAHPDLVLPPVLNITQAGPLLESLQRRRGEDLRIDASGVEKLGGQCLQLLLSAAQTAALDGTLFEIRGASDEFVRSLHLYGVDPNTLHAQELRQ